MILEWFLRFIPSGSTTNEDGQEQALPEGVHGHEGVHTNSPHGGFFANATGSNFHQPMMFDMQNPQFYQMTYNTIMNGTTALERLLPYTCPGAAVDSSARHPPPQCHPGTRQRIGSVLEKWLNNPHRLWKVTWLSGFAGTGKSAVAQTFAELCAKKCRLGASYFFSRPNNRNDPRTVVPTIAYQLAVYLPDYRPLLANCIANDPAILDKTPRAQMASLIVEPLSILQMRSHRIAHSPLVVVLDGLDECRGIDVLCGVDAQCDIIEMIGEVVRLKADLPLIWLISSRPEPHLKYIFSRADFSIGCGREMLVIDAETRGDVERYLRDSFSDIRARFPYVTDASWPSGPQLQEVIDTSSGLFVLASTIIRYIGDSSHANSMGRLVDSLAFMGNADRVVTGNPLETLDLLYSRILDDIPDDILPTTKLILGLGIYFELIHAGIGSVQTLCNFLCLTRHEFYNALAKVHSLVDVPSPEKATDVHLRVYHASFEDYLRSSVRSGRFFINERDIYVESSKMALFWYTTILDVSDGAKSTSTTTIFPGLKWSSSQADPEIFWAIKFFSHNQWGMRYSVLTHGNVRDLLTQIEDCDFRYMMPGGSQHFYRFTKWLYNSGSLNTLLRTTPNNHLDEILLEKVNLKLAQCLKPINFSKVLPSGYLIIGHGVRTCLFWFIARRTKGRCWLRTPALPGQNYTVGDCVIQKLGPKWWDDMGFISMISPMCSWKSDE